MAKPKKTPRPKAQTPKGFRDYFGAEVTHRAQMLGKIAAVYHRYGFDALESSAVETVEALGKFLPDVDRPNEGVFAWQEDADTDKPGDWLALRYDLTAPLARVYAQHQNDLPKPYRRYAMGPVWRNEKPGPGRFRQFYQCDADTVGTGSVAADAEICAMLADCLEEVGIERGDYIVRVNNRKVLNGVMEVAGLSGDDKEAERGIVLRAIDKLDRLGVEGVRALLGEGRKDESGDFTEGAGLNEAQVGVVMGFVDANSFTSASLSERAEDIAEISKGEADQTVAASMSGQPVFIKNQNFLGTYRKRWNEAVLEHLEELVEQSPVGKMGIAELRSISELLDKSGYHADRIVIDPSVVRGLGYYTGPVFEAE
ncbi:MAG: HisS family protein, partial [Sulfitobacter sp.]